MHDTFREALPGRLQTEMRGQAALTMWYDVAPEAVEEHDDWHTHEHMPERLSIAGFNRGSRWVSRSEQSSYFVLYEVSDLSVLSSAAYSEKLDDPTPWTTKIMPQFRGMTRGLCAIVQSAGSGVGSALLTARFFPSPDDETKFVAWIGRLLPQLATSPGLASADVLVAAAQPQMTSEQQIRGLDATVSWVLLVTAYRAESLTKLRDNELHPVEVRNAGLSAEFVVGFYNQQFAIARPYSA